MKKLNIMALICLFSLFVNRVYGQVVEVSGHVYERLAERSEPIPGVTVMIRGEKGEKGNGALTKMDGSFRLKADRNATLIFSYMGFRTVEMKVAKAKKNMDVFMEESVNTMDETVVVAYQSQSRADVGASVTVVNTKDLPPAPVSNVMELLQGRVAGLNVQQNNGAPGSIGTYTIRGISDISVQGVGDGEDEQYILGSSAPLFVIDGIPQEDVGDYDANGLLSGSGVSPLSSLPFEDIEDITVLKDAAATAQYGSRGAYGVILIRTKRGNSAKPQIDFSMDMKVNIPPRLRDVLVGRAERMSRIDQILQNDTSRWNGYYDVNGNQALTDSLNPYYNNNTDWQGNYYRRTVNQTYNLSVKGGSTKFNYKINGNYYSEEGIITNTDFNRYGIRTNMGYAPTEKFNLYVGVNATLGITGSGSGNALQQTGVASGASASSLLPPPSIYSASNAALGALMVEQNTTSVSYDANINMNYQLPWNIRWNVTAGYTYNNTENEKFTPGMLNSNQAQLYGLSKYSDRLYGRTSLSYSGSTGILKYGLTVTGEISSNRSNGNEIKQTGLVNDYLWGPLGYASSWAEAVTSEEDNTVSFNIAPTIGFKNLTGGKDKYVITPTIRPEANSAYGRGVKWVVNPGVSVRWNFDEEKFFKKLNWNWVDYSAIRASWGRVVKYKATKYDVWGNYLLGSDTYNGNTVIPIDFGNMPNNNIDPITTTQWNVGLDFGLWNNRLSFQGDWYYKQVDNQLSSIELADHNGFDKVPTTEVSLVNYGMELALVVRPFRPKSNWSMDIMTNFTINRDVMTKLPDEARMIINSKAEVVNKLGSNAMSNFLYVYKGVYATDADVPVDPATGLRLRVGGEGVSSDNPNAYFKAGDPIWADLNGDYVIDEKDKAIVGNSQPRVIGGLSVNLRYKNLALFTSCSFTLRRDIVNQVLANNFASLNDPNIKGGDGMYKNAALTPISAYDFWTPTNTHADYPNPYDYQHSSVIKPFRADQTLFLEDGSYFKINAITLSYTLPKKWTNFIRIRHASIRMSLNNLYTFTKYSGINPENVSSIGWDQSGGYPNARTFSMGLTIGL